MVTATMLRQMALFLKQGAILLSHLMSLRRTALRYDACLPLGTGADAE
jgi:hypothetical protein